MKYHFPYSFISLEVILLENNFSKAQVNLFVIQPDDVVFLVVFFLFFFFFFFFFFLSPERFQI